MELLEPRSKLVATRPKPVILGFVVVTLLLVGWAASINPVVSGNLSPATPGLAREKVLEAEEL